MTETDIHHNQMTNTLLHPLKERYRDKPTVYVSGNLLLYYKEGKPSASAKARREAEARAAEEAEAVSSQKLGGGDGGLSFLFFLSVISVNPCSFLGSRARIKIKKDFQSFYFGG